MPPYMTRMIYSLMLLIYLTSLFFVEAQISAEKQARNLIVMVEGMLGKSSTFGAGIIVGYGDDKVYIATANHLVRKDLLEIDDLRVSFNDVPGQTFPAELATNEFPGLDLAVLIVSDADNIINSGTIPFQLMGDARSLSRGDNVYTLGYDRGRSWWSPITPLRFSDRELHTLLVESVINDRGVSGGGLFNENWELVGMVTSHQAPEIHATSIEAIIDILQKAAYPIDLGIDRTEFDVSSSTPDSISGAKNEATGRLGIQTRGLPEGIEVQVEIRLPSGEYESIISNGNFLELPTGQYEIIVTDLTNLGMTYKPVISNLVVQLTEGRWKR